MTDSAPNYRNSTFMRDVAERVLWTGVQGAVALVIVLVPDWEIPVQYTPIIMGALALLKGFVARHVDPQKDSASTVPGV